MATNGIFVLKTSAWLVKTSNSGWLNLSLARQVEFEHHTDNVMISRITWSDGDCQAFGRDDTKEIHQAWQEYTKKYMDVPNG